ncbi:MAG: class I SAM-dependent methyltransferase, partial [Candidatus Paceibacterota bacterium]
MTTRSYTRLLDNVIQDNNFFVLEGHSLQVKDEAIDLIKILLNNKCENILEIGFNCGHSSALFLANSNANVVSFDLGEHAHVNHCKQIIDNMFPNRHQLILGDSLKTIPEYIKNNSSKFDIIFIDGGHSFECAASDIYNCQYFVNDNTIVILDDTINDISLVAEWNAGVNEAWKFYKDRNYIKELYSVDYYRGRGISYGKYIAPINMPLNHILLRNVSDLIVKELKSPMQSIELRKTVVLDNVINHYNRFTLINKPLRNNNKMFYIVYHIATIHENWKILTERSYKKIISSGILDDLNCKKMFISYLGEECNINPLLKIWQHPKIELKNFGTNKERYEFPAMELIREISKNEECNILYFHCRLFTSAGHLFW